VHHENEFLVPICNFTEKGVDMKKNILIGCFFLVVGLLFLVRNAVAERAIKVTSILDGRALHKAFSTGDNHALVIGINNYKYHPNLKTAIKDAKAVARLLEDKYFFSKNKIVFLKNTEATKANILKAFRDLVAQNVKKGDNVFIYYAGHGWFDDILETGYWVTSEATKDSATFLENNIIYKYITALDKKGVQHVLMVSDSCFAGSFVKEHRAIETEIDDRYFREKYKKPSRNILTSGGMEPVADGGRDGHSVFAYYFLKTLQDNTRPFLSAKQLGVAVEQLVCRNSDQTTISRFIHGAGDEGGQFFFINSKSYESGQVTESVLSEDVFLPKEGETSFDDILKASETKRKAVEKWEKWQQSREGDYQKVKQIDKDTYLSPKQKAIAWQRFLAAASQDNPYSRQDDEMRSYSRSRVSHWENVKPTKKIEPSSSTSFTDSESKITGSDGTVIAYATGVVYDKKTGLEWVAGPDRNTTWNEARRWVESLNVTGSGWRMPTRAELKTLYKKGAGSRNITPLLKMTGWFVWSDETKGSSSAWAFAFTFGHELWDARDYSGPTRGFAVRLKRKTVSRDDKKITNSLGMEFVYIPPGTFMMGSPSGEKGRLKDEKQHRVTLTKGFYMQTTEVTQGQWRAVMGSNPSHFKSCGDDCPIEKVSWNDVQKFIQKLNQREDSGAYRLPTEAEWEYTCRAGSTTAFANGGISELHCGYDSNLSAMGWYCGNSNKKTHSVARKNPNTWGLYDMHGNVFEWCQDWYGNYPSSSVTDPTGPSGGLNRVMRGGSWNGGAMYCHSANRLDANPGNRIYYVGFRLLRNP